MNKYSLISLCLASLALHVTAAPDIFNYFRSTESKVYRAIESKISAGKSQGYQSAFLEKLGPYMKKNYLEPASSKAERKEMAEFLLTYVQSIDAHPATKPLKKLNLDYFQRQARLKGLPLGFFRDIKSAGGQIKFTRNKKNTDSYSHIWNTISLSHDLADKSITKWTPFEWGLFYNELFHAWWDIVYTDEYYDQDVDFYQKSRNAVRYKRYIHKYKLVSHEQPFLAMEEGYSETVGRIILVMLKKDLDLDELVYEKEVGPEKLWTAMPVGHFGVTEGFTRRAENTYPDENEWYDIVSWLR